MLGKLMKHEFRATGRIAVPLCGAMLALAVLAGIVIRFWGLLRDGWQGMTGNAIIILYGMSLFAVAVGIFIILMQHFKQNLFSDEGYLMRTLPVSVHELLLSKLFVAVIWYIVAGALMALSVLLAGSLTGEVNWGAVGDALNVLRYHLSQIGAGEIVRVILNVLGSAMFLTLLFYAVAVIAQNFSKHRLLYYFMVIVIFIALVRLLAVLNLAFAAQIFNSMEESSVGIIGGADGPTAIYVTGGPRWVGLIELYLGNVLLYFLTWGFLTKRPNLE